MGLLSKIQQGISRKDTIVAGFALNEGGGPGGEYLRNGYYGIYQAAYGNYVGALGGYITDQRAMSTAAVFGGIKIIAEDIGSLSFATKKRVSETETQTLYDHPLYSLLHDSPNPDMTAMEFREALTAHALLTGTGFAGIERSRVQSGAPIMAFWPWMPYEVTRDQDSKGRPVFIYKPGNSPSKTYQSSEVFTLNGFGLTGKGGLSIMQYARTTLGLTAITEEYAARFFSQDQTPNIVLSFPNKLGKEGVEGVKEAWAKRHAGKDNWHTPAVIGEGGTVVKLRPDAKDSQMIEQRAFQLLEVCRYLRLSPHKLADMSRATWGNVEQLNINHYTETLRPWCERWEQAVKLRCLREEPRVFVKHNIAGFLRGDFKTQTDGFGKLLQNGVYSINEVRALLDLNPCEGGDEHLVQLNMQDVIQAAAAAMASEPQGDQAGAQA